jgi:hypothetical protein
MDWYHLDTSQLKCIHSMWELCWIVKQLLSYSPCSECIKFVAMHSCGAHAMVFFSLSCSQANRGIYVSYGRYCVTNPVGHTHMLCCGFLRTKFIGLCFMCGCSVESYLFVACATCSCTTKGHPRPLACQQG